MEVDHTSHGWAVVTGANRGIGLEFVRQLFNAGGKVAACCRNPDKAAELARLQACALDRLRIVPLDLCHEESIKSGSEELRNLPGGIRLLIHNAGVFAHNEQGIANFKMLEMLRVFRVNLFGPLALTRELLAALHHQTGKIFILTSRTGALRPPAEGDKPGSQFSYPCSKAAVNRAVSILADDLRPAGIVVGGIDPGWVRTDMTSGAPLKDRFLLEPEVSVRGMLQVMQSKDLAESGRLWRWNGGLSNWYAPEETAAERQEADC